MKTAEEILDKVLKEHKTWANGSERACIMDAMREYASEQTADLQNENVQLREALEELLRSVNPRDIQEKKVTLGVELKNYVGSRQAPSCESIIKAAKLIGYVETKD
jgi:hypothetical protein